MKFRGLDQAKNNWLAHLEFGIQGNYQDCDTYTELFTR